MSTSEQQEPYAHSCPSTEQEVPTRGRGSGQPVGVSHAAHDHSPPSESVPADGVQGTQLHRPCAYVQVPANGQAALLAMAPHAGHCDELAVQDGSGGSRSQVKACDSVVEPQEATVVQCGSVPYSQTRPAEQEVPAVGRDAGQLPCTVGGSPPPSVRAAVRPLQPTNSRIRGSNNTVARARAR